MDNTTWKKYAIMIRKGEIIGGMRGVQRVMGLPDLSEVDKLKAINKFDEYMGLIEREGFMTDDLMKKLEDYTNKLEKHNNKKK